MTENCMKNFLALVCNPNIKYVITVKRKDIITSSVKNRDNLLATINAPADTEPSARSRSNSAISCSHKR